MGVQLVDPGDFGEVVAAMAAALTLSANLSNFAIASGLPSLSTAAAKARGDTARVYATGSCCVLVPDSPAPILSGAFMRSRLRPRLLS